MKYSEVEAEIRRWVDEAPDDAVRAFGRETVVLLTLSAAELGRELATIDDGILADGDLDTEVLAALQALEHWQGYLEQNGREEIRELAIRAVEDVDHEVSAALDDFLATPQMAAEYDRIRRLLNPTAE